MSFEDIMKLQTKVGTKVYNEVAYGSNTKQEISKKKRLNKNRWTALRAQAGASPFNTCSMFTVHVCDFRPMEISAKKPAPFLRQVVPVRKPVSDGKPVVSFRVLHSAGITLN